jgi:hypothetical protein
LVGPVLLGQLSFKNHHDDSPVEFGTLLSLIDLSMRRDWMYSDSSSEAIESVCTLSTKFFLKRDYSNVIFSAEKQV